MNTSCSNSLSTKNNDQLNAHIQTEHMSLRVKLPSLKIFKCTSCDYFCNLNIKLKHHIRKYHEVTDQLVAADDHTILLKKLNDQNLRILKEMRAMRKEFRSDIDKNKFSY